MMRGLRGTRWGFAITAQGGRRTSEEVCLWRGRLAFDQHRGFVRKFAGLICSRSWRSSLVFSFLTRRNRKMDGKVLDTLLSQWTVLQSLARHSMGAGLNPWAQWQPNQLSATAWRPQHCSQNIVNRLFAERIGWLTSRHPTQLNACSQEVVNRLFGRYLNPDQRVG
jgi:hypothetical protein